MKKRAEIIILPFMLLTSCLYTNYPQYGGYKFPKTNPEEIVIYSKDIDQSYEIIGSIGTDVDGDSEDAIVELKKKAAKLGADAIIHVKLNNAAKFSPQTEISGIAIKLNEIADNNL